MRRNMENDTKMRKMDWMINRIAIQDQNYARWGILSCEITPQKDIVLGLHDIQKTKALIENGWMVLLIGTNVSLTIA